MHPLTAPVLFYPNSFTRIRSALEQADGSKASDAYIDDYTKKHGIPVVDPQWIQCDVRNLDVSVLGKFGVVMADPPWKIEMNL